jgi:hypothetical protein
MPVPYFRQKAPSLAMMGYRPIPILPSSKKPLVLDWPHYNFPTGDQERYAYASVGVLCGSGLMVVDADIYDAALASRVMRSCLTRLGLTSHRTGLLPKFALPYRIDASTGKFCSRGYINPLDPRRKVNKLEILGQGNYLVTHGIHPQTQMEYRWPVEDLAQVPIERLEKVSIGAVQEVIRDFETQCAIQGYEATNSHKQLAQSHRPSSQGQHAADTDKVLAAIAVIPNTDRDYDSWISVGLAIKGALGDTQEGLEAWLDFSAQYEGNNLDTCIAKWDSFHPQIIGAGTLLHMAQEAQRKQALKLFKPITPEAHAADTARDVAAASLLPPLQVQALDAPTYLAPAGAFNAALGRSGWLVKRVLHQASIYTVTAHASAGKTTLLALLAACIQSGQPFCGVDVKQGQVLYCAADDPYGVLDRLEALAQHGYPAARDILVSAAAFDATSLEAQQQLIQLAQTIGSIRLIVLDTVLYYTPSSVESENDNLALSRFLAQLKELTKLPGKPTILVLCHPRKGALNTADELIPRGGSAVLAASDGNLAIWREDDMVTLHHSAKMRGAFEELTFQLQRGVSTGLLDEDGEAVLTVQAMPMQEEALAELQRQEQSRLQQVLGYLQGQQAGVWMGAPAIELALQLPRRTVQRHLRQLLEARRIRRTGYARATAYQVVGSL